jgi:transposase-like protein
VLAPALINLILRHLCPYCGHVTTRKGAFFSAAAHYICTACAKRVPLTYADKIKLFRAHNGQKSTRSARANVQ